MRVGPNTTIAIDYTVRLESGEVVDTTQGQKPLVFHFGREEIIPGLERELTGLEPGDSRELVLAPEDAYGLRLPEAVQSVPLDRFPEELKPEPGMQLIVHGSAGNQIPATVREVSDGNAELDFNHPLAGERLSFSVQVRDVQVVDGE